MRRALRRALRALAPRPAMAQDASGLLRLGQNATQMASEQLGRLSQQVGQAASKRDCISCGEAYLWAGMLSCAECRQPVCRECWTSFSLLGPAAPKERQVHCKSCKELVRQRVRERNVQLRRQRSEAYLAGRLEPFAYDPESKLETTVRLSGHVMTGLNKVSGFLPWGQAAQAIRAGYYVVRYGPLIFAGNEILESFQLIFGLAKKLEMPAYHRLTSPDFFGGLYYSMAEHWGERGRAPQMETAQHSQGGQVPEVDRALLLTLRHLVRLLLVSKEDSATDAQRLLRQAMPGAELVLAELSNSSTIPSFFLVCARGAKAAYLVMPGTRNVADIATDSNATEEPFGEGQGHKGIVQSARWMAEEVGPVLLDLHNAGYRVTILGHSLGAGVGAFLTLMLRPQMPNLYCYGFGTPACVDEDLLPSFLGCMISVVNRDDLIPRLSLKSVQELMQSVLCPGQVAKTKAWMQEDWQAIKDLERIVELRRRPAQEGAPAPEGEEEMKLLQLMEAGVDRDRALRALRAENGDLNSAMLRATAEEVESPANEAPPSAPPEPPTSDPAARAQAAMSWLGGRLQEASQQVAHSAQQVAAGLHRGREEPPPLPPPREQNPFLVPGQVIHLYRRNGLGRAARCEATHEALTHIVPSKDMLTDHKMQSYARALHQACIQEPKAPEWESFEARELCACCNADFSWAYVLHSEPQKMLSRHHCFACGRVVCEGCSRKRLAHEHLGFQLPVRTCDSCAFAQFEGADEALVAFANEEEAAKLAASSC
ncbi:unnamed protein product [Effrenium voratum]|uniref:sn-1-specific diacylglycerol lipase n=1 Tax=Effrenium voratum TaxID=2562239 RepID=A0AA36NLJ5_9DINO|nr:unnamed protein product [Effrenium voratum]